MSRLSLNHCCFNHAAREAVARCPECRRFFCRECVTEHSTRVLCASCLARQVAGPVAPRPGIRIWGLRGLQAFFGLILVVAFFYAMGRFLLTLPTSYHEGTLWRNTWDRLSR